MSAGRSRPQLALDRRQELDMLMRQNGGTVTPAQIVAFAVRNETGVVDIRARPLWRKWAADVRITFDGDQFTATDVVNLLMRAGLQVGIGEGRPDSKKSAGMGYGLFTVEQAA